MCLISDNVYLNVFLLTVYIAHDNVNLIHDIFTYYNLLIIYFDK